MIKLYLLFSLTFKCVVLIKTKDCGYKQCPQTRTGALNVHLVPHSHMDAGWVKTFDQYYHGTKTSSSTANVQLIYHSVLSELLHDKRRKFTFSETSYFWRWWKEQRPATRSTFRVLVQEGRIEFAGGGWVQNDEATLDYQQIIDQFTWGLRKLNDTLGLCGKPKAGWQIDTYGHTREQASLLAQMGYDGMFIGRVDFKERESMIDEDRMEFMWRGNDVLGKMSDIMTHATYNLYNAPDGFCFDYLCTDEPIVDDPDNVEGNADKRVSDFISQVERQAKYYDHDNILVTMGGDFTHQAAASWFINTDKIINYVNSHPGNFSDINVFYSSPSCYLKAIYLHGRRNKALYTERSDHLPYGSDSNTYWTGFYTSRPNFKYLVRRANHFLQVVKQLSVISRVGDSYELHLLRHAVSLVAHHDTITGTSQQHVINDIVRQLNDAMQLATKKLANIVNILTPSWAGRRAKNNPQFVICHLLNISQCEFTETQESMMLMVYNPSSVKSYHHVRLPAIALHYTIKDFSDEDVEYQLVPLQAAVLNLPSRTSSSIQELWFEAENIPPLGYSAFYIAPIRDQLMEGEFAKKADTKEETQETINYISNEYLKVSVDQTTGLLTSVQHIEGAVLQVTQNFHYYSQLQRGLQSGAYAFRPSSDKPTPVSSKATYSTIRGTLVKEIRQRFSDWVSQEIRLYRGEEFVEFEWTIGPVPVGSDLGKEVVSIFSTNISSNCVFYTDSNGRQMMKRSCWNESSAHPTKKPLPSCYYPVTSRVCIMASNTSTEVCVLVDRPQGATSYRNGEIEIMVHRKLLTDDGFGLEESLNEEEFGIGVIVRGKHRLYFGSSKEVDGMSFSERAAALSRRWSREPLLLFTAGDNVSRRKWTSVRNKRFSVLKPHGLPRHIHILTLEPWKGGSVLLRLENTIEKSKRGPRSKATDGLDDLQPHITVDLRKVFMMKIRHVRETTLAANQWLEDARQMDWSSRYVYQGSDDGMLPEDIVDHEDESKRKESETYSEEELDHARLPKGKRVRLQTQRIRIRPREERHFERKKRDSSYGGNVTKTESIGENLPKNNSIETNEVKDFKIDAINENLPTNVDDKSITESTLPRKSNLYNVSVPNNGIFTSINGWSTMKVARRPKTDKLEVNSEETTDDLINVPKRKTLNRVPSRDVLLRKDDGEEFTQNPETEVTRSMYEMYYKRTAKSNNARMLAQSTERKHRQSYTKLSRKRAGDDYRDSQEDYRRRQRRIKKNRRYKKTEDSQEYERQYRRDGVDEKRFKNQERQNRRNYPQTNDYDSREMKELDKEEKEMESDRDYGESRTGRRNKRELLKDDDPQKEVDIPPEPDTKERVEADDDYIVSLRPTQIRTFVIWFEPNKRN